MMSMCKPNQSDQMLIFNQENTDEVDYNQRSPDSFLFDSTNWYFRFSKYVTDLNLDT